MDQREERQILEMVYLTAKQDYEMIDKILFSWNTFCTDCYGANITLRIHELISYQQSLLRVVKKNTLSVNKNRIYGNSK